MFLDGNGCFCRGLLIFCSLSMLCYFGKGKNERLGWLICGMGNGELRLLFAK